MQVTKVILRGYWYGVVSRVAQYNYICVANEERVKQKSNKIKCCFLKKIKIYVIRKKVIIDDLFLLPLFQESKKHFGWRQTCMNYAIHNVFIKTMVECQNFLMFMICLIKNHIFPEGNLDTKLVQTCFEITGKMSFEYTN